MEKRYSKLKEEIMDLVGTISVDELVSNHRLIPVIKDISDCLKDISITARYELKEY